jgi:hypothetical protein
MASAGDGEKFGESFDDAENGGFKQQNGIHKFKMLVMPGLTRHPVVLFDWIPACAGMTTWLLSVN